MKVGGNCKKINFSKAYAMAQFAVIEQAKKSLKTVQDYIKVGMETTIDVAQDFADSKIG